MVRTVACLLREEVAGSTVLLLISASKMSGQGTSSSSFDDYPPVFTLTRDDVVRKIKGVKNLNIQNLGKVFGLFPQSITLLSYDGFVEVPNDEGFFQNVVEFLQWSVEGEGISGRGSASSLAPSHHLAHQPPDAKAKGGKQKWRPAYSTTSVRPVSSAHRSIGSNQPPGVIRQQQTPDAKDKEWNKKIDICKLEGNSWKKTNNIHIN